MDAKKMIETMALLQILKSSAVQSHENEMNTIIIRVKKENFDFVIDEAINIIHEAMENAFME